MPPSVRTGLTMVAGSIGDGPRPEVSELRAGAGSACPSALVHKVRGRGRMPSSGAGGEHPNTQHPGSYRSTG